jgi:tetratricopeptide (TPR) repeat protein
MKFFQKLFKGSSIEINLIDSDDSKMEEAGRIIVEATSVKDTNIGESIELIKRAISKFPDNSSYFKLAKYLYDADRKEECFETYNELIIKFSFDDFTSNKNMVRSEVFKKKAILEYKEKNYQTYVLDSCLSLYNWCIGLAIQGRIEELVNVLESDDITEFMTRTKFIKSFEHLEVIDQYHTFIKGLSTLINIDSETLTRLADIYNKTDFGKSEDIEFNQTVGEQEDKILLRNKEFNNLYSMLEESKIEKLVNDMIRNAL